MYISYVCIFCADADNLITLCSDLNRICTGIAWENPRSDVATEDIPRAVSMHMES